VGDPGLNGIPWIVLLPLAVVLVVLVLVLVMMGAGENTGVCRAFSNIHVCPSKRR